MDLLNMNDDELLEIANEIWDDFVEASNSKNYQKLSRKFSKEMLEFATEKNIQLQWDSAPLLSSLIKERTHLGILRQGEFISILWNQHSSKESGDFLARLVLGMENNEIKIFGASVS